MPEKRIFSSTRDILPQDFNGDLQRLLGSFAPSESSMSTSLSSSNLPTGPLSSGDPTNTGKGNRVKIPRFISTENGKRFGIQVESDEIRSNTDFTDAALLADLQLAIRELGFVVLITDALRVGAEANSIGAGRASRHVKGQALDIGAINGVRATLDHPNYPNNQNAIRLVQWFIQHGYVAGTERGNARVVLFGNSSFGWNRTKIPHHHHIHISLR